MHCANLPKLSTSIVSLCVTLARIHTIRTIFGELTNEQFLRMCPLLLLTALMNYESIGGRIRCIQRSTFGISVGQYSVCQGQEPKTNGCSKFGSLERTATPVIAGTQWVIKPLFMSPLHKEERGFVIEIHPISGVLPQFYEQFGWLLHFMASSIDRFLPFWFVSRIFSQSKRQRSI